YAVQLGFPVVGVSLVIAGAGEQGINARLAAALVFQKHVRDAAVSGNDEDASEQVAALATVLDDVVPNGGVVAHRRSADFLDCVLHVGSSHEERKSSAVLARTCRGVKDSRVAMNSGRGG